MKKILALVLALTMVMAMAACTPANNNDATNGTTEATEGTTETTGATVSGPASALELLTNVWAQFPKEEGMSVMGGDETNFNDNGPGAVTIAGVEGNPLWSLQIPDDQLVNFTDAATMQTLNANVFTCGAVKLAAGADKAAVAKAITDSILAAHWMCGFPERMIVASVGDYLVIAYGQGNNIPNLVTTLNKIDAGTQILHDEAIG